MIAARFHCGVDRARKEAQLVQAQAAMRSEAGAGALPEVLSFSTALNPNTLTLGRYNQSLVALTLRVAL